VPSVTLPSDARLGGVRVRVADRGPAVDFYAGALGFTVLEEDHTTTLLGTTSGEALLVLESVPGAPPRPPGTTGLFHVAFLLPRRADLGAMIRRVRDAGVPFQGFADHNVSEAAYLSDPAGNGIELCVDRSRHLWGSPGGEIVMTTQALDVPALLAATPGPAPALPEGTRVGHVHLRVSTLEAAEAFYVHRLGMAVTTRRYPGALFFSAGGYHHHVAANVWGGVGLPHPAPGHQGLVSFDVVVPGEDARRGLLGGAAEGMLHDLDDVGVRIVGS
jgi:catechol 2,3-dioxygenase